MPCPMKPSVWTVIFWDLINSVPGLGTELILYGTACPTNAPVQPVFFEDLIVRWYIEPAPRPPGMAKMLSRCYIQY